MQKTKHLSRRKPTFEIIYKATTGFTLSYYRDKNSQLQPIKSIWILKELELQ